MVAPHGTSNNGMGEACPLNGDDNAPTSSDHPATIVQDGLEIFVPRFRSWDLEIPRLIKTWYPFSLWTQSIFFTEILGWIFVQTNLKPSIILSIKVSHPSPGRNGVPLKMTRGVQKMRPCTLRGSPTGYLTPFPSKVNLLVEDPLKLFIFGIFLFSILLFQHIEDVRCSWSRLIQCNIRAAAVQCSAQLLLCNCYCSATLLVDPVAQVCNLIDSAICNVFAEHWMSNVPCAMTAGWHSLRLVLTESPAGLIHNCVLNVCSV